MDRGPSARPLLWFGWSSRGRLSVAGQIADATVEIGDGFDKVSRRRPAENGIALRRRAALCNEFSVLLSENLALADQEHAAGMVALQGGEISIEAGAEETGAGCEVCFGKGAAGVHGCLRCPGLGRAAGCGVGGNHKTGFLTGST
ncbi:hypothetical protein OCAR_5548 [Afipia carboxidovorans OM5]|nr:hypothetical protein OCAR_5548 [Afipia carboxidovorans OM5]